MPDIPNNVTTTAAFDGDLTTLATFSGELESFGDSDWIRITLTAGTLYQFFGSAASAGVNGGDTILQLFNASGTPVASQLNDNDPAPPGGTSNSFLFFPPTLSGTYFLQVSQTGGVAGSDPGSYSIAIVGAPVGLEQLRQRLTTGADVVSSTASHLIVGDKGDDVIDLAAGGTFFNLLGEQGDDRLVGAGFIDYISGGLGNDTIFGNGSFDRLFGDAGDDYIDGGPDGDRISGGDGADRLLGQDGEDTILGGAGADYIDAGNHSDFVDGGPGADFLYGGFGDDTIFVDNAADRVLESGGGNDTVVASVSFALGVELEKLTLAGATPINATGNGLVNVLTGNGAANVLNGLALGDTMIGLAGNDIYVVDNALDTVSEAAGSGIDIVYAGISFSLLPGAHVVGAVERLVLTGTAASGVGNAAANVLTGNAAGNSLSGLGNDDVLNGGPGNDKLTGGAGLDTLTGGLNNDFFVFNAPLLSANRDTVTDFSNTAVNNDTIYLENAVMTKLGTGVHLLSATSFRAGAAAADPNDYIIYDRATGLLSYDSNGAGAGGVTFLAVLANRPLLAYNDFVVF